MAADWTLTGFGDEIDSDPAIQLPVLRALGAARLELRSAWGTNVVELDPLQLDRLGEFLTHYEVGVSAIASPIGKVAVDLPVEHEIERLHRAIEVAHRFEARFIRVFSFWPAGPAGDAHTTGGIGALGDGVAAGMRDGVLARLRALAAVAARNDVVLLHENEKGIYGDVPSRVLDIVESVGSDALRLAWDSANYVQCGVRPHSDGWHLLHHHVEYLQVKDADAATGQVVAAGEGDGELRETLTALRDGRYQGYASLEPHLLVGEPLGGFSGPSAFGRAARAFRALTDEIGVRLV